MWVVVIHQLFALTFYDSITVRHTRDAYADDVQYFASRKVTLDNNGNLRMRRLGLGKPGDQFLARHMFEF